MNYEKDTLGISDRYLLSHKLSSQSPSPSATLTAFGSAAAAADCASLRAGLMRNCETESTTFSLWGLYYKNA